MKPKRINLVYLQDLRNWFRYGKEFGWKYVLTFRWKQKVYNRKHNLKKRKIYGPNWYKKRTSKLSYLIRKHGLKCNRCKNKFARNQLTLDHIIPMSKGGTWEKKNLQILCIECHTLKDKYNI